MAIRLWAALALVAAILAGPCDAAAQEAARDPETISWDDLMPEGEIEILESMIRDKAATGGFGHSELSMDIPIAEQMGTFNTVPTLDGKKTRLPGYIVPLEYNADGLVSEFLLVPYFGACIHEPPPPPNQIVFVRGAEPIKFGSPWEPVWITGTMRTQSHMNHVGNTAYSLELDSWEAYDG